MKKMFCPECGNHAANKTIRNLEESGRIGKEVQSYKEILPEATCGFRMGGYTAQTDSAPFNEGETVTVVVDGVAYTEAAKRHIFHEEDFEMPIVYIGNPAPMGLEDNGAPYMVYGLTAESDGVDQYGVSVAVMSEWPQTNASEHRLHIYKPETIHPIDQKYLPGVCLPVVELSTNLSTGAILTDEESAKLTEAYAAECPVVIKCDITLGTLKILYCSIIFSRGKMYGDVTAPVFYASFGSTTLVLMYMFDVGWMFQAN